MPNYNTLMLVDDVVAEWTDQGRAFTAFEVTLETRNRGGTERHRDLRDSIHAAMQNFIRNCNAAQGERDDYMETENVFVGEENGQRLLAILYHPSHYDVSQYVPLPRHGNSNQPNQPAHPSRLATPVPSISVVTPALPAPAKGRDGDVKTVDKRSTLLIPNQIIKEAGMKPFEKVYVCTDPAGFIVVTNNPGSRVTVGEYTVDSHHNVRITQHVLSKAGLPGTEYEVLGTDQEVKIRLA